MRMCLIEAEYAAVCATELMESDEYQCIVERMKKLGIWSDEFKGYHTIISSIALVI